MFNNCDVQSYRIRQKHRFLDYCNAVLASLLAATPSPFQRVGLLNAAARLLLDLKPRDHVTSAQFASCTGYPLDNESNTAVSTRSQDISRSSTRLHVRPAHTGPPVADMPSRSSLRASSSGNLTLPRTNFGATVHSHCTWNRLPTELKRMRSTTTTFKPGASLGGGGAGGLWTSPPRIVVKCKNFALPASSNGSLYCSHNGR